MTVLAPHLSNFLRAHLPRERNASPHTIAAYAHSFTLLVRFAAERLKKRPSDLAVEDIDSDLVLAFLDHIEESRANTARSRNARLAAIRAFFRYLEYQAPACLDQAWVRGHEAHVRKHRLFIDEVGRRILSVCLSGSLGFRGI